MNPYIINKNLDIPLYIQLRDNIEHAIKEGDLSPGDKLPAVAHIAKEVGVTQATVRRALKDLKDMGHTLCHVGRGTFVQDASTVQRKEIDAPDSCAGFPVSPPERLPRGGSSLENAAWQLRMGVSKALGDIMSLADKPGIIHLARGTSDPALLPETFLEEVVSETLAGKPAALIESTPPAGLFELRQAVAEHFSLQNIEVGPEQVLITNGSLQAVTLVAQALRESKPAIIVETPCFKGIPDTFSAMGHWVETVGRDAQGPRVDQLSRLGARSPALMYLCPYAQNPTGTSLSTERYAELADWAAHTGATILADELFRDLCYDEPQVPSLMKALGPERVIAVGSLSKTVMTGLRVGWLISTAERVNRIIRYKRLMDISSSSFAQGMALTILKSGRYTRHTQYMRAVYRKRMAAMLKALERNMPKEVHWSKPDGGFSMLLELPKGYSSIALFLSAVERGVSFLPGPFFDIDQRFVNCIRLSCAWHADDRIKEGIELLAGAVDELLQRPPGDLGLSGLGSFQ